MRNNNALLSICNFNKWLKYSNSDFTFEVTSRKIGENLYVRTTSNHHVKHDKRLNKLLVEYQNYTR